jgi:regulator of sigma D
MRPPRTDEAASPSRKASPPLQERRTGSRELVKKLLEERTEMLVLYCRLAGLEPFDEPKRRGSAQKLLQEFCQVLVDYIAAGHFALYERIANGSERREALAVLAAKYYPRIAETTDVALAFNDKYDCEDHCEITPDLAKDLSQLGEQLAARIELEDQLLKLLI